MRRSAGKTCTTPDVEVRPTQRSWMSESIANLTGFQVSFRPTEGDADTVVLYHHFGLVR